MPEALARFRALLSRCDAANVQDGQILLDEVTVGDLRKMLEPHEEPIPLNKVFDLTKLKGAV